MNKKAQQEIVGFVLIVTLVVVGLMVYLAISVRGSDENVDSLEVANILDALMKQTTTCAISSVPDYDDFEHLFKSAYDGDKCSNLNQDATDYLETSLRETLSDIMATESSVTAYQLTFSEKDEDDNMQGILLIEEGNCTGSISSARRTLSANSVKLIIQLKTCSI